MDSCNLNFTFLSFLSLLLLLLSFYTSTATEDVCSLIECGQGTCKASNHSLLGFVCECKPGWRKIQIGPLNFPSCLIPNCTIDFHCDKGSPLPSPSPAFLPPPSNHTNHCDYVSCGDGSCMTNGTGYICQCYQGSVNLLNSSALACVKPCHFGVDCQYLGIDLPLGSLHPHPRPSPPPPPLLSSGSLRSDNGNGFNGLSKCLRSVMTVLLAAFVSWF